MRAALLLLVVLLGFSSVGIVGFQRGARFATAPRRTHRPNEPMVPVGASFTPPRAAGTPSTPSAPQGLPELIHAPKDYVPDLRSLSYDRPITVIHPDSSVSVFKLAKKTYADGYEKLVPVTLRARPIRAPLGTQD